MKDSRRLHDRYLAIPCGIFLPLGFGAIGIMPHNRRIRLGYHLHWDRRLECVCQVKRVSISVLADLGMPCQDKIAKIGPNGASRTECVPSGCPAHKCLEHVPLKIFRRWVREDVRLLFNVASNTGENVHESAFDEVAQAPSQGIFSGRGRAEP